MKTIVGWDIGGANLKAALLCGENGEWEVAGVASQAFEIWRRRDQLAEALASMAAELDSQTPAALGSQNSTVLGRQNPAALGSQTPTALGSQNPTAQGVTMTAELSDAFATKREGVLFVIDALLQAFPGVPGYILGQDGALAALPDARLDPLRYAATNWLASSRYLAKFYPDGILLDVGTTTTDVIPILNGTLINLGSNDLERLISGELVYTGALRTHLAAIVQKVPVRGQLCPVSSEYFAISGDVHLITGHLRPEEYSCPAPDGRPASLECARQRLARLVCADTEMLSPDEIDAMAVFVHQAQVDQIALALQRVRSRLPADLSLPVLGMGSGSFLGLEAARRCGLTYVDLGEVWGAEGSKIGPCIAIGHILAEALARGPV